MKRAFLVFSVFCTITASVSVAQKLKSPLSSGSGFPLSNDVFDVNEILVADFNGDGLQDIIAINGNELPGRNIVSINRGEAADLAYSNGYVRGSQFLTDWHFLGESAALSRAGAAGDIDGDGDLDVLVGNFRSPNRLYKNRGDGTFESSVVLSNESEITVDVLLDDFNGDGYADAVVVNLYGGGYLRLNNGDGTFGEKMFLGDEDGQRSAAKSIDVDSDGDLDIVMINYKRKDQVFLNDGDAAFPDVVEFGDAAFETQGAALGDIDGDGLPDIVLLQGKAGINIYLNEAGNIFGRALGMAVGNSKIEKNYQDAAIADFNGDGFTDIAIANKGAQNIFYLTRKRKFDFDQVPFGGETRSTVSVTLCDINNDGYPDLGVGNLRNRITIMKNRLAPRK